MSTWSPIPPPYECVTREWRNESGFVLEQLTTNCISREGLEYALGSWWIFPSHDRSAIAYCAWEALYPGDQIDPPFDWADEMIRGWESPGRERYWMPVNWDLVLELRADPNYETFTARDMRHPFGIDGP